MTGMDIRNCDCMDLLRSLPAGSVDLVVTDPPYAIQTSGGGAFGYDKCSYYSELEGMADGIPEAVLEELFRVMKAPNLYIWGNWKQIFNILVWLEATHRDVNTTLLSWHKSNPVPACNNKYLCDTEYCIFIRGKGVRLDMTYKRAHTYWVTPTNTKDKGVFNHPTVKPEEIIRQMVLNSSSEGDLVLDPYLGSGTTAKVCMDLGRRCVGSEIDPAHYRTVLVRLGI